jgi:hypothetical protein
MRQARCHLISYGVLFALSLWIPTVLWAWGADGHETVGAIADQLIQTTRAEREVHQLLRDGETLMSVSVWADCAKGFLYCEAEPSPEMKEFTDKNAQHKDYHFTDIPFESAGYREATVGAGENDVVHIIRQCIHVLLRQTDHQYNPHDFTPRQALLLLVHLIGDIHQPLHVGTAYMTRQDKFGVPLQQAELDSHYFEVTKADNYLMKSATQSLHIYWDESTVKNSMRTLHTTSPAEYAESLLRKYPDPDTLTGDLEQWPVTWADESLKAAKVVHSGVGVGPREMGQDRDGHHLMWSITALPKTYTQTSEDLAEKAVMRAGKRLALVLKAIWPD